MKTRKIKLTLACLTLLFLAANAWAQTTAFSYQGSLKDGGTPANGSFQMQFKLFDSLAGVGQIGSTITDVPVTVSQGTFAVKLDFAASALSGANRWIEVAVRRNAGEAYTTLSPREQITSAPYSVRTLSAASADNALSLGGVVASEYLTNSTLSTNSIRNQTTQQPTSNFNISGDGTAASMTVNGAVSLGGIAPPAAAPAGQGRVYFDSASNKVKVSENGSAFVDLVGATGVSGGGTTNSIPFWSAGNVGIGTTDPLTNLDVRAASAPIRMGQRKCGWKRCLGQWW